MPKKIQLSKDKVIVFMGSMNAMPMMYALELKRLGYEVIYFVDAPRSDTLSRPECHFPDIEYPYPSWIVESLLPSQILLPFLPRLFAALYQRKIKRLTRKALGCVVLNGFFCSLAPYLAEYVSKIGLSHGSDLDVWANIENRNTLAQSFKGRSIFKYLPRSIADTLIKYVVNRQYFGFSRSDAVVYFPLGFSAAGDKVIRRLTAQGVRCIPRYDASFEQFRGQSREFKEQSDTLEILSVVRFLFRTFPDGDRGSNKGNDLIIEGIAKYHSLNPNLSVHFIEKGEDVQCAKELCRALGLEPVVVWHKEMPFKELLALLIRSDICFDQLGDHWIGAGMYALFLGKPLVANVGPAVPSGVWPIDHPVCTARNADEVCEWLVKLSDRETRREVSTRSKKFAEAHLGSSEVLNCLFDFDGSDAQP
jgi:glycosyltransferase involved in cell wall biosynthesis